MRTFVAIVLGTALLIAEPAIAQSDVEDILVVRSWRLTRNDATAFCAQDRTGFEKQTVEDTYHFKSVSTDTTTGRVTDADVQVVGRLHACFGGTAEAGVFTFYAEGSLGTVAFSGKGECRVVRNDFPESGLRSTRCHMILSGLPDPYAGGLLTTNTITSRNQLGGVSDPWGYVQPSIATVRLWKKRRE
jgi:hypothetical protein